MELFWQLKAKGNVGKMCSMQFLDPPTLHSRVKNIVIMNLIEKIHTLTQSHTQIYLHSFFVRSTCSLPRYTGVECSVSINTV